MAMCPKEYTMPPGKLGELRQKFEALSTGPPPYELGLAFQPLHALSPQPPLRASSQPPSQHWPHRVSPRSTSPLGMARTAASAAASVNTALPPFHATTLSSQALQTGGMPISSARSSASTTFGLRFSGNGGHSSATLATSRLTMSSATSNFTCNASGTANSGNAGNVQRMARSSASTETVPQEHQSAKFEQMVRATAVKADLRHTSGSKEPRVTEADVQLCVSGSSTPDSRAANSKGANQRIPGNSVSEDSGSPADHRKHSERRGTPLSLGNAVRVQEDDAPSTSATVRADESGNHLSKISPVIPMTAPPKPPRTFEHDVYVKRKHGQSCQETAGEAAKPLNHYEELEYCAEAVMSPAVTPKPAQSPEAEARMKSNSSAIYESLVGFTGLEKKPPPLPPRRPEQQQPMSPADLKAEENAASDASEGRVAATVHRFGLNLRHHMRRALLPSRDRRQKEAKRCLSEECIWAGGSPKLAESSSHTSCNTRSSAPATDEAGYAIPEVPKRRNAVVGVSRSRKLGTLVRASSENSLAAAEIAAAEARHWRHSAVPPSPEGGLNENVFLPSPHISQVAASKRPGADQNRARLKVNQAFLVLGQTGRRSRCASMDEDNSANTRVGVDEESGNDSRKALLQKRLKHCSFVREQSLYASAKKVHEYATNVYPQLYQYALVTGLQCCTLEGNTGAKRYEPYVIFKFPAQVNVEKTYVPQFCFPDADVWQEVKDYKNETYSFVLTDVDGSRLYGYCMRYLLPSRSHAMLHPTPEVVCITSPLSAFKFYSQVLDEFFLRRQASSQRAEDFLQAAYGKPLPKPGFSVAVRAMSERDQSELVTFVRGVDSHADNVSYDCLLHTLSSRQIVAIFSAILHERKVVLCAEKLSTLSPCIHSIVSLVYPFAWQHTLIPVLPPSLVEIACSPTPFIVGALASSLEQIMGLDMDEVLVVNLDAQKFVVTVGDEPSLLPKRLHKALTGALDIARAEPRCQDMVVSEAFLRFFFESVGSMEDYFVNREDGRRYFEKEKFVASASDNVTAVEFLQWFSETQMFEVYIAEMSEEPSGFKKGGYEEKFNAWLAEASNSSDRTAIKTFFRNIFNKAKAKK